MTRLPSFPSQPCAAKGSPAWRSAARLLSSLVVLCGACASPVEPREAGGMSGRDGQDGLFRPLPARAGSLGARQPRSGMVATFDNEGVHLEHPLDAAATAPQGNPGLRDGAMALTATLTEYGCAQSLQVAESIEPRLAADARRVEYARRLAVEWYANGPLGFEHGFTVPQDLNCEQGRLRFVLTLSSGAGNLVQLSPTPYGDRIGVELGPVGGPRERYVYSGLRASDARGQTLPASLSTEGNRIYVDVEGAGALYPIAVDPVWTEEVILSPSLAKDLSYFGLSMAMQGDTAVVGAPYTLLGSMYCGVAYVYVRTAGRWREEAMLSPSDCSGMDYFGSSVSIAEDTILVTAERKTVGGVALQGQVYVFERSGGVWREAARLTAWDGGYEDRFGSDAALSGDTIVVGARGRRVGTHLRQGMLYVFVRGAGTWSLQAQLVASDGADGDLFGLHVALAGDTILAGVSANPARPTSPYAHVIVFHRAGSSWTEQARLQSPDGAAAVNFASRLALDEDTALVADYNFPVGAYASQGKVYVYRRSGSLWRLEAGLTSSDGRSSDLFGVSVAIHGDVALVGASNKTIAGRPRQGEAYAFVRSSGTWTEHAQFVASDGDTRDQFGASVAIHGSTALVGAPAHRMMGATVGQAYALIPANRGLDGTPCAGAPDCVSSYCVDGMCCDGACGRGATDDCQSCMRAQTGQSDGTCAPIAAAHAYVCRAPAAICDKPELCDGLHTSCPTDTPYQAADLHRCREATECSPRLYCDGLSQDCPLPLCGPASF